MTVQSQDREKVVPECSGREISRIFSGKIWFAGNGIQERRPLAPTIAGPPNYTKDLDPLVLHLENRLCMIGKMKKIVCHDTETSSYQESVDTLTFTILFSAAHALKFL